MNIKKPLNVPKCQNCCINKMADITEGMSLITSVTTLFVDAIRAAFPDFPVTASDALVGYGMSCVT